MYAKGKTSFTDPKGDVQKQFCETWLEWENKVENQKAVYDYLMSVPTSLKWLYDDANIPHTNYQKEVGQKCLPLEIKWLDSSPAFVISKRENQRRVKIRVKW